MVEVINFSEQPSLLSDYMAEMRHIDIQKDSMRFRRNIERTGEILAYEISRRLKYDLSEVPTPLATAHNYRLSDNVVIGTILRAGLPFHSGFLNYFDHAENAFVSAYRKYKDKLKFDIFVEYIACPDLTNKVLILTDPMLATGGSMELAYRALLSRGTPQSIHFASVIASRQAVEYLCGVIDPSVKATLWVAAIDEELNEHSYIVPGLGDAGDLAFGAKL
ncbi:uracil phosphoribosyltransferase [Porphyromonas circumdentaria]|uniref:Uracil phosphoribosyltransferase n=1 Tax=Porphyromonas circumdentaria TaxID=29524 RepID=A0A1T4MV94_9PORP|nr:uracil phosphoribosyltransferase [Porphyromonas circumdentaria]MBB6275943.1 uracil phosphoribosyltransferase [Porphyromonas circumdentaria]MDO4721993.1 uracil phosphoribosyltransferase [Porphyromonas circumdentaria]SJZ70776.1 uracil phosphoribosyltransferase [Porphyromonas circumdentaria]